jgi:hypothetical protein
MAIDPFLWLGRLVCLEHLMAVRRRRSDFGQGLPISFLCTLEMPASTGQHKRTLPWEWMISDHGGLWIVQRADGGWYFMQLGLYARQRPHRELTCRAWGRACSHEKSFTDLPTTTIDRALPTTMSRIVRGASPIRCPQGPTRGRPTKQLPGQT